jgi:hypothetical protein
MRIMQRRYIRRPAIVTAGILLIPLVMTILDRGKPEGDGWHWRPGSFIVMGALLFGAGLTYEILASKVDSKGYRVAVGIVIAISVLAIWFELAVDGVSQTVKLLLG